MIKPSNDWKFATTMLREIQALRIGASYFDAFFEKTVPNTKEFEQFIKEITKNLLTSPAYVFPEKKELLKHIRKEEYLKP